MLISVLFIPGSPALKKKKRIKGKQLELINTNTNNILSIVHQLDIVKRKENVVDGLQQGVIIK